MNSQDFDAETYNPWTIVNLVFHHLAEQGLHPSLGQEGNPGEAGAALLRSLGIVPGFADDGRNSPEVQQELAAVRAAIMEDD